MLRGNHAAVAKFQPFLRFDGEEEVGGEERGGEDWFQPFLRFDVAQRPRLHSLYDGDAVSTLLEIRHNNFVEKCKSWHFEDDVSTLLEIRRNIQNKPGGVTH